MVTPVHPSITHKQISDLVDNFYAAILKHADLGPIFRTHIKKDWHAHLERMKEFWRSILLKTGEYKGNPVAKHRQIDALGTPRFRQWLELFTKIARQIFSPEVSLIVERTAQRIASSLWLSRSNDPFANPPIWGNLAQ